MKVYLCKKVNYKCIAETTYHQPENFKLKNCIFKTFKIVKEKGSEPSFILSGYVVLCRIKKIREPNSIQSLHDSQTGESTALVPNPRMDWKVHQVNVY